MRLAEASHVVERADAGREAADVETGPRDRDGLVREIPGRGTARNAFGIAAADDREVRCGMKAERVALAHCGHSGL